MSEKWRYETTFETVRLNGSDEVVAYPCGPSGKSEIRDRRGRLIAAAPEMYEWLNAIVNVFQKGNMINVDGIRELLARIDGRKIKND